MSCRYCSSWSGRSCGASGARTRAARLQTGSGVCLVALPLPLLAALLPPLTYLGIAHIHFAHYSWLVAAFPIAAFVEALQQRLETRQASLAGSVRVVALLVCVAVPMIIIFIPVGRNDEQSG